MTDGRDEAFAAVEWEHMLKKRSKKGPPEACLSNIYLVLKHDERWEGVVAFDEFAQRVVKLKKPPYIDDSAEGWSHEWNDTDDSRCNVWMTQNYKISASSGMVAEAIQTIADDHKFHPVREYLAGLEWDGMPRLRHMLSAYFGAGKWANESNDEYLAMVGEFFMTAAVARVMRPGCKADNVLILEGAQGLGKSSGLKILAGGDDWFSDTPFNLGDKDSYQMMRGKWIIEMAELDSFNKADATRLKAFFSSTSDNYRQSFGRRNKDYARQCIFAGTTNQHEYFRDSTGNRRYWPVLCTKLDAEELIADRDQLWAEAVHLYRERKRWWPVGDERAVFEEQQRSREIADPWEGIIGAWLDELNPDILRGDHPSEFVTVNAVLNDALKVEKSRQDERAMAMRVGKCLRALGAHKKQFTGKVKRQSSRFYYYFEAER